MPRIIASVIGLLLGLAVPTLVLAGYCSLPDNESVAIIVNDLFEHPPKQWRGFSPYLTSSYYQTTEQSAYLSVMGTDKPDQPYCRFTVHHPATPGYRPVIRHFHLYRVTRDSRMALNPQFQVRQIYRLPFDTDYEVLAAPPPAAPSEDPAWPQASEDEDPEWTQIETGIEDEFWAAVACDNPAQVQAYLKTYPQGRHVVEAQACLAQQGQQVQQRPASPPAPATNPDADGCWTPTNGCVLSEARWAWDDSLLTNYTNQCGGRIILQHCHELAYEGTPYDPHHCGSTILLPNMTAAWRTDRLTMLRGHPTGRYATQWVGSLRMENDEICMRKVSYWYDEPVY